MKKTVYMAPTTCVIRVKSEQLLNTISDPQTTNVTGLGVSNDNYEDEIRSRQYSVWDEDEE